MRLEAATEAWPDLPPPSPRALEFAARLERSDLPPQDLLVVARALERKGVEVLLPPRPRDIGAEGSLVVRSQKCGRRNCRCKDGGEHLHGPYVYHVLRVGGKVRFKYLGRLGRAKSPQPLAPALERELRALNDRARRFPTEALID